MNQLIISGTEWVSECESKNTMRNVTSTQIVNDHQSNCSVFFYQCQTLTFLSFPIENILSFIVETLGEFEVYNASVITQFLEVHLPPPRLIQF